MKAFWAAVAARGIRWTTGAQARWVGVDPVDAHGRRVQRIYFANHTSHLDAPVIWASLPEELRQRTSPVAAKDYWDATRFRRWLACGVFGAVLIERRPKVSARANPLAPALQALAAGRSLVLFPEGTRGGNGDGGMKTFKPGLWHLARAHPDVELVPVHLENLNRILPKGDVLPVPVLAAVVFGHALPKVNSETKAAFLARARRAVEELGAATEREGR